MIDYQWMRELGRLLERQREIDRMREIGRTLNGPFAELVLRPLAQQMQMQQQIIEKARHLDAIRSLLPPRSF